MRPWQARCRDRFRQAFSASRVAPPQILQGGCDPHPAAIVCTPSRQALQGRTHQAPHSRSRQAFSVLQRSPYLGLQLRNGGREAVEAHEQSDLPLETTRGLPLARGFVVAVKVACCPGCHSAVVSCRVVPADPVRHSRLNALDHRPTYR